MSGYGIAGADARMEQVLAPLGWRRQAPGFLVQESAALSDLVKAVAALAEGTIPPDSRLFAIGESVDLAAALAGGAGSGEAARRESSQRVEEGSVPAPFPSETVSAHTASAAVRSSLGAAPLGFGNVATERPSAPFVPASSAEEALSQPGDPLSALLASGFFDEDDEKGSDSKGAVGAAPCFTDADVNAAGARGVSPAAMAERGPAEPGTEAPASGGNADGENAQNVSSVSDESDEDDGYDDYDLEMLRVFGLRP